MRRVVKDAIFEGLEDYAVSSFDLAVAPWVHDRRVVNVDQVVLTEVPKLGTGEGRPEVGDDPIRNTKAMSDLFDEFCSLGRLDACHRLDFNPLGEFVHRDKDVLVAARAIRNGPTESRPHMVKGQDGGMVRNA